MIKMVAIGLSTVFSFRLLFLLPAESDSLFSFFFFLSTLLIEHDVAVSYQWLWCWSALDLSGKCLSLNRIVC